MSALSSGLCRPGIILYLAFVILAARSTHSAPVFDSESTQVAEYDEGTSGCHYNFKHYQEGERIITSEPCLNCTCNNRMLMCYLRVCPFTKAIGQDCTIEKRPDQCCPIITCPGVPVQLLTSTTTSASSLASSSTPTTTGLIDFDDSSSSTEVGFADTYGCNVDGNFFADGALMPPNPNNPCELCYCIRNKTNCLMQECTLHIEGCKPVKRPGVCCPVKYKCDYDKQNDDTIGTTQKGLIISTTLAPNTAPPQCEYEGKMYDDGDDIYTKPPCERCYCLGGKIICAVMTCGKPMESHGKNCTAIPPTEGTAECCPTYKCDNGSGNIVPEIPQIEDEKSVTPPLEEKEKQQQESFPGADNVIPDVIISKPELTTESQTASHFGNEVPESKPTSSTPTEESTTHDEILLKTDDDKSKPSGDLLPELETTEINDKLAEVPEIKSASEISPESEKETSLEPEIFTTTISSEISSTIKDENISHINKEDESTAPLSMVTDASTESVKTEIATVVAEEKPTEASYDNDLLKETTTEKVLVSETPLSESSTYNNEKVDTIQANIITTEKEFSEELTTIVSEITEKSSESSSPISEVTTEKNVSKEVIDTDSTTEAVKNIDIAQDAELTTEYDQTNIIESTSEKIQVKQDGESMTSEISETPTELSFEEKRDEIITTSIAPSVIDIISDNNQTSAPKLPSSTENEKINTEAPIDHDAHRESAETTESINADYSTEILLDNEQATSVNSVENETPERVDVTSEKPTTLIAENENVTEGILIKDTSESTTKTGSILDKKEESTEKSTDDLSLPEEEKLSSTEKIPIVDESSEKTRIDETSQPVTEMQYPDKPATQADIEEPITSEQGATGIPIPDRVPEHKAEDKDAVSDFEVTESYVTSSGIPHKIDSLETDLPEYGPTTYLPPVGSSTASNRYSSTPPYEDLPKEESENEGRTTEISITPKASLDRTTIPSIDKKFENEIHAEKTEPFESSTNISSEEKESNEVTTTAKDLSEETVTNEINTILPEDHTSDAKLDEAGTEISQKSTDQPLIQEIITNFPSSTHQPITIKNESAERTESSSAINENIMPTESTTIFDHVEDHSKPSLIDQEKDSEKQLNEEKETVESVKENAITTESSDIEQQTTKLIESTSQIQVTDKTSDIQEITEESTTIQEINSEEPELQDTNKDLLTTVLTNEPNSTQSISRTDQPTETELSTQTPSLNKTETDYDIPNKATEKLDEMITESEKDFEPSVTDKSVFEENINKETEKPFDTSANTEDNKSSSYTELPIEISSSEIKTEDQTFSKEIPTSETETQNKPNEEDKIENDKSQLPSIVPTTVSSDIHETESSNKDVTSLISSSEGYTEQTESTEGLKVENESSHTTESNIISSQAPEIEIEMSPGIPGEGNCLVDGQSYNNNSAIPPANPCQLSCRCVSSIIQCEHVKCSPPPTDLPNCTPIYSDENSCCPMYTCDSASSVVLEADNQKSDYHTTVSNDKSQFSTTQNTLIEKSTNVVEISSIPSETEIEKQPDFKLQPEIVESTSIKLETEEESITPVSPVEGETESFSNPKEDISTSSEKPESSTKVNDDELLSTTDKNETLNKDETTEPVGSSDKKESTPTNTESVPVTLTEEVTIIPSGTEMVSLHSDAELEGQDVVSRLDQSTESEENASKLIPDNNLTSTEVSSSTERLSDNKLDLNEISTSSNVLKEIKEETSSSDESIQENQTTEKFIENENEDTVTDMTVTTDEPVESKTKKSDSESTEKSTLPEESLSTIRDSFEILSSTTTEKVEKETQMSEDSGLEMNTLSTNASIIETVTNKSSINIEEEEAIESTSLSHDVVEPEEIHPESSTSIFDQQSTSTTTTSKPVEANDANESQDYTTEQVDDLEVTTISASSSISPIATEENITVSVFVNKPEEETSSIPSVNKPVEEITPVETTEESMDSSTVLLTATDESTMLNAVNASESIVENSKPSSEISSTAPISENYTEKSVSVEEEITEKTPIESQPEDKTESVDNMHIGSSSEETKEKPKEETTAISKETSERPQTINEDNIISSTTAETEIKLQPTESVTETETETLKSNTDVITELPIEIKKPEKTEPSTVFESKKEDAEISTSHSEELESPATEEPIKIDHEHPLEISTEIAIDNKTTTASSKDEFEPTKSEFEKEVSSHEPSLTTKMDSDSDEDPEILTASAEKELTALDTSSEEASTTNAISVDPSSTSASDEKPNEKEQSTPSTVSEESDSGISKESQTTSSYDLQGSSTKGSILQDEITSPESDVTVSEDDLYHIDAHQTEEPNMPSSHEHENLGPIESYTTTLHPLTRPKFPDQQVTETDDEHMFPPDSTDVKHPIETDDGDTEDYDDHMFGPGTCRYGGKIYLSAQQIPRDDPCDFCFCFRSDIICLQQSCPPPISGCHEEPIGGFCCPRYECPVSMATSFNLTTTTTTTTTTLPPHFNVHAYEKNATRGGCLIGNKAYKVHENIETKSTPCMDCICGGDGNMQCNPKNCSAEPTLHQIHQAIARKRRRRAIKS